MAFIQSSSGLASALTRLYKAISTFFSLQKVVTGVCHETPPCTSLTYGDVTNSCSRETRHYSFSGAASWLAGISRLSAVLRGTGAQYAFHCHLYDLDNNKKVSYFKIAINVSGFLTSSVTYVGKQVHLLQRYLSSGW